jgi:hypothetical protein
MPQEMSKRKAISKLAIERLSSLFSKLPLRRLPLKSIGVTDEDHGSHHKVLNFVTNNFQGEVIGDLVFGHHENRHCCSFDSSSFGLTSLTRNNPSVLHFTKAVVMSLCDVRIPHHFGHLRINTIRGARTTPHTDNMRGPTVNLVCFHSATDTVVDARMMVRCWPEFRTSVVELNGDLFIPFLHTECEDSLVMIGPGRGNVSHLTQDLGKHSKAASVKKKGSATFFEFRSSVVELLRPHGGLNFAVLGLSDGCLQTTPFLSPFDPSGESCKSPTHAMNIPWEEAVKFASAHKHLPSRKNAMTRQVGNVANTWLQFYGWRFIHWFEGDPMVPRTHGFFRFVREHNSGGNLRRKSEPSRNFVDKRSTDFNMP